MKSHTIPLIFLLASLFAACTNSYSSKEYNKGISIVPMPNEITQKKGSFAITEDTKIVIPENGEMKTIVDYFTSKIKHSTNMQLAVNSSEEVENAIVFKLIPEANMADEAYILNVEKEKIFIESKTTRGAFYAVQTLLQLLPAEVESKKPLEAISLNIPLVTVKDQPAFPYRGMHLDVCRHFFPIDFIKKQLDVMAMFKLNYFHWHLTEDQGWRIEIKKYPKLTEVGSKRKEGEGHEYGPFYYTQEEIKEIVKYAEERFITVVPEIELPGHALAALVAYPEYSCTGGPFEVRNVWGVEPDVYCAGKESTFRFLSDIIDEVVALFPSPYFHIGGDECPKERWKKCNACQHRIRTEGLKDEHELQSYFVQRVGKMLEKHGKKMIGWDEILEGGLAPSATVMSWRGEDGGIASANQGHDVIMTPGGWCYLDHYQASPKVQPHTIGGYTTLEKSYSYHPIPEKIAADKAHHVLGTQGNLWSEYFYSEEKAEWQAYPRIIALAEVGWTNRENKDFEDFMKRLPKQFVRLDYHDINYYVPIPEGPANNISFSDSVTLDFSTVEPIDMYYTLDGSEPTLQSNKYKDPLTFTENTTVKIRAIFPWGKTSPVRTINAVKEEPTAATKSTPERDGLIMKTAEGAFHMTSELEKVKEWETSVVTNIDKADALFDYKKPSAAILEGYIYIPTTDTYRFSSEVTQLYIDDKLFVNNDGEVKKHSHKDYTADMEKGWHRVKIVYLNNIIGGYPSVWNALKVDYKTPKDEKFQSFSNAMYKH